MCGIAGIAQNHRIVINPTKCLDAVRRACDAMKHRGPDDHGIWSSDDGLATLGHRRLSVLDVTDAARQPMLSDDGRHVLVYNGECYNFRELRDRAKSAGRAFLSSGDTEVVLDRLATRGEAGLSDLRGMFALALWDKETLSLLLARDRFGIKPLYYCEQNGRLLFASEIRALLAGGLLEGRLSRDALIAYLLNGFVPEPETILAGVTMLAPGAWLKWRADTAQIQHGRFAKAWEAPDKSVSRDELRQAFMDAVASHLASDVPIGAFLSSGVDSSAIVGAMSRVAGTDTRTLTVTFPDNADYSEGRQAATWAKACGARHLEVPVTGSELLESLPAALAAQDQPTADGINTYMVSKAARGAGLTVVLSGLGGDELFGGYASFRDIPGMLRLRRMINGAAAPAGRLVRLLSAPYGKRLAKAADMLEAPPDITGLYAARRRVFSPAQCMRLCPSLAPEIAARRSIAPDPSHCIAPVSEHIHPPDAIASLELSWYMRNQLLRDGDFMSMASSIEMRVPFLDAPFAELAWRAGARARDGKRFFIEALDGLLPRGIVERPKRGFTFPFADWMRGPLRDMVAERLSELPECFDRKETSYLWRAFLRNPNRVGWSRPWTLFALGDYLRRNGPAPV